jgi:DNA-binding MarR family transcriptional regulator
MNHDLVDQVLEDWKEARPDLDVSGLGIASRIGLLCKVLARRDKEALATLELAPWACDVLLALRRQGPPYELTPTDVRKVTLLTSGATTTRLDGLEEAGLVLRSPDPSDRRSSRIALSEEGLTLANRAIEARLRMVDDLVSVFSEDERVSAAGLLRKLLLHGGAE